MLPLLIQCRDPVDGDSRSVNTSASPANAGCSDQKRIKCRRHGLPLRRRPARESSLGYTSPPTLTISPGTPFAPGRGDRCAWCCAHRKSRVFCEGDAYQDSRHSRLNLPRAERTGRSLQPSATSTLAEKTQRGSVRVRCYRARAAFARLIPNPPDDGGVDADSQIDRIPAHRRSR